MTDHALKGSVGTASAFDNADFYDCRDAERFEHQRLDECIEAYVDDLGSPGDDIVKTIHDAGTLEVSAYIVKAVSQEEADRVAADLLDTAEQRWDEEYGDFEDKSAEFVDFLPRLKALVWEMFQSQKPWQCERVGKREFSPEEIEALVRKERPDWFNDEKERP